MLMSGRSSTRTRRAPAAEAILRPDNTGRFQSLVAAEDITRGDTIVVGQDGRVYQWRPGMGTISGKSTRAVRRGETAQYDDRTGDYGTPRL
jgi:hypothetical protein